MSKYALELLKEELENGASITDIIVNQYYKFDFEDYRVIVKELLYTYPTETKEQQAEVIEELTEQFEDEE